MRLTNVAHLRLPFGRLYGYDVAASEPGAALPVSFDQARHVSGGDRPGSWMALSFRLPDPVPREQLASAWLAVIARHGTLRTAFLPGPDGPTLHEISVRPGNWVEHAIGPGQAVNDALRDVLDDACSPYRRPAHRLCVLETAAGPTVIVAADHSHTDMWSMLVIARDLLAALEDVRAGRAPSTEVVPPFVDHTRALADRPAAPEDVRRRWAEIITASGGVMPLFPLPLGTPEAHRERVEVRDVFGTDEVAAFAAAAREAGVSTLSATVAALTRVTLDLAGAPLRAVFPVHSRYDETWHDSVGWFITNSVLDSPSAEPAAAAEAVKEAVRLGSWPLADVLEQWGGMPEAPGMFAISWLDLRRLPVRVDATRLDAQYVGATIRTDGVMLWFILDEAGLHLRCRYPDTLEARANVGAWLDGVVRELQARAAVGGVLRGIGGTPYRVERARRDDVPAIVALLADDELGATREVGDAAEYDSAFELVTRDRSQYLAVIRDDAGHVVGTMHLTVIPGLSRSGSTRLQIEGVRVARGHRSQGLGTAMIEWAHHHGRTHGAVLSQLTTDVSRDRARAFYTRLGYRSEHVGLKRTL
ncbi:GNAT family N-acetyltransferase [Tsukamurella tyrosinosolvens]|uniref:GNAT family N-acetyltransferase n=1 Tax=Tsukamurella tyrosinosolvens TaxID=57704 RepID=UPI00079B5B05|nr:GNAT family N-acetyltransferase [Tsukamurella tyrosinosolvens]KXP02131.1 peptide synthetase [Tsukamurella tyrosinosolvens]MCA4996130.1 GNAT family N-acetyltransferase [Tsukamurella tyrosinosolvens]WEL93550.1 GNAT family N-acetyltransferase [Tsukamurella tyrosinosolvens]